MQPKEEKQSFKALMVPENVHSAFDVIASMKKNKLYISVLDAFEVYADVLPDYEANMI